MGNARSHNVFLSILLFTLSSRCCGNETNLEGKIIGGFDAKLNEFPAFVALFVSETNQNKFLCGGCYVREFWIITAAHCLLNSKTLEKRPPDTVYTRMGMHRLDDHCQQRIPEELILHPQYKPMPQQTKFRDIGLVKLMLPFDITYDTVRLAALNARRKISREVAVVGFGVINETIFKPSEVMQRVDLVVLKKRGDTLVCQDTTPKGVCYGDSGGPLYVRKTQLVVGIVSAGVCTKGIGYYTNVRCYEKWLKNIMGMGVQLSARMALCICSFLLLLLYRYILIYFLNNK
ncbi:hypothetical protein Trydic_g2898 [Trypoxylus dichotomus]